MAWVAVGLVMKTKTTMRMILNAGIMELPELERVNGLEKQFVVNYLGHYLLTMRLLEQIKASPR